MTGPDRERDEWAVPPWLAIGGALAWRLLVIAAAIAVLWHVIAQLRVVWLAVIFAIFATAVLRPPALWLRSRGWTPALASAAVLVSALTLFAGLVWLLVPAFLEQVDDLSDGVSGGIEVIREWLREGPLGFSERQLDNYLDDVVEAAHANSEEIARRVVSGAQLVAEVVIALVLSVVLTFFFLKDGERISAWFVGLFAPQRRPQVEEVSGLSWGVLSSYLRGMTVVALFDAVFIGLALVLLDVPAALPLAVITFFGAYIPIAGAFVTGLAAVLVALVANGLGTALLVLAAVVFVQQTESNFLHPVVVGHAVAIHPVAILLAVTAGALAAGIVGAFVAVPVAAMLTRVAGYLRNEKDRKETAVALK